MQTFQSLLAKKISDALRHAGLPEAGELTQATDPRFGDYQSNVALVLGKQRRENPRALAEKIVGHLDVDDFCERPVVAGAGFINFTLRPAAIEKQTLDIVRDERLGVAKIESPRRIVIDFGSPNVAKPMHAKLFKRGEYVPLRTSGTFAECCVSFLRRFNDKWIMVISPRLSSRVGFPPIGELWKDTAIELPETLELEKAHDLFTCRPVSARDHQVKLANAFAVLPFAVITDL